MKDRKLVLGALVAACVGALNQNKVFIITPCSVKETPDALSGPMLNRRSDFESSSVCPPSKGKKRQNNDFGYGKNCKWPGRKVQR